MKNRTISALLFLLFVVSTAQSSSIRSSGVASELGEHDSQQRQPDVEVSREERALPASSSLHRPTVEDQDEYNSYVCDWLDNHQYRCEEKYGCHHYDFDKNGNVICTSHESSQRQWSPSDPFPEYFKLYELVPAEPRGEVIMSCSFYPDRERAQCYRDATNRCAQPGAECDNPWDLTMITFKVENNRLLPGEVIDAADEASRTRRYHAEFDEFQLMESYDPYYRSVDMHL